MSESTTRTYAEWLAHWRAHRPTIGKPVIDQVLDTRTEWTTIDEDRIQEQIVTKYRAANTLKSMVLKDVAPGIVYPGSIVWAQPLIAGRLVPLGHVKNRPELTVTGIGGRLTTHFTFDGRYSQFAEKMNTIVGSLEKTAPRLEVEVQTAKDISSAFLKLGISANYWVAAMSARADERSHGTSSIGILSVNQVFYSAVVDTPPLGGYLPEMSIEASDGMPFVLERIKEEGELAYIRKVDYGRRVIIIVASNSAEDELHAALKASADFGVGGGGVDFNARHKEILADLRSQICIVGGKFDDSLFDIVTSQHGYLSHFRNFLKATSNWDESTVAVPVSFHVSFVQDDEPLQVFEVHEYAGTVPGRVKCRAKQVPVCKAVGTSPQHATLESGDDDVASNDWTYVELTTQALRITQDRKRVILDLVWHIYEGTHKKEIDHNRTRYRSAASIEVFNIDTGGICPDRTISTVGGPPHERTPSNWLKGVLRNEQALSNSEYLSEVFAVVDQGGSDRGCIALRAVCEFVVQLNEDP